MTVATGRMIGRVILQQLLPLIRPVDFGRFVHFIRDAL